jgi:predicted Zn-dependent peptidase
MTIPKIHDIEHISFPTPEEITLKNNIKLFGFNGVKNDVLRIDILFNSGRWTEPAKLVAEAATKLFKSGTSSLSSYDLNEKIDFYGSTIKSSAGYNTFTVSLYCMNRFLEPSLQLLRTCLSDIIFPENEIDVFQKNSISKLKINLEKNDYLADVTFKNTIYGKDHPYGYEVTEDAIKNITQKLLIQFYNQDIQPENATVFIAGKYGENEIKLIDNYIGEWTKHNNNSSTKHINWQTDNKAASQKIHIKKPNAVQSSIIIGKELFNRHHEDFASFILLNTIFGGYFGSRLMSNIREDKGLTYGIYSSLAALKHNGIFSIQTDTNLENLDLCLREIYTEIERLQNELIPAKEIMLAKNYLLGKFLARTDGAFNQIDVFKSYFIENVAIDKFHDIVETIKATDALSLQLLAQKYLLKDTLVEVVVG